MSKNSCNIFLVRHGETLWNLEKRWQGSKNSPLSPLGEKQARQAKEKLLRYNIDVAYVSSLKRTQDTSDIILKNRAIKVEILDGIQEINMGEWEGKTQNEVQLTYPNELDLFLNSPESFSIKGAETYLEVQSRVVKSLEYISASHKNTNVLVVSHGVAIKVALAHYCLIPLCELSTMDNPQNGSIICLRLGENAVGINEI